MQNAHLDTFRKSLLTWYDREFRELSWRKTSDPYKIWISETMLQQTQVIKVEPYYGKFITEFSSVEILARADLSNVLKAWEGLGYYARARNLHKAAQKIVNEHNGQFPHTIEAMLALPGIGRYTAAAIASIAFSQPVAAVDGNVIRVLARVYRREENPKSTAGKAAFQKLADSTLDPKRPGDFNQAMMELGAVICKPSSPKCGECPVFKQCGAFSDKTQSYFPYRQPAKKRPHKHIAIGIIKKSGKLLIARRPQDAMLGGLWEFPGGKVEEGETLEQTVIRELKEELGITVSVDRFFMKVNHQYSHFTITLHAFICQHRSGTPSALGCADWKWVKRGELDNFAFPKANKVILQNLLKG